ncbi:MAG TPA: dienelactone hydrolase family protein [Thermoanaerobaculia bacterium]|jgi:carboxymethylenebutenolidase|nr:dienelactone hydrolase family protein [Thermoanaerobaculia bacterium]
MLATNALLLLLALSPQKEAPAPMPPVRPTAPSPDEGRPPSEKEAKAALEASPRHGELVDVKRAAGAPIRTWIVYPERKDKAPVVILIHEIFGLSDWMRGVADRLAKEGFIAVAPDLLSGLGPGGGGTESAASRDDVVKLVRGLSPEETRARLDAVRDWAAKIPSANGKVATMGFCWGGAASFSYAAARPALSAAVVFYGVSPAAEELAKLTVPVLGLYGGDDARVTSTIEPAKAELAKRGKTFEANVYDGAGHGFLRAQEDREGKNLEAARKAWPRAVKFLEEKTKK